MQEEQLFSKNNGIYYTNKKLANEMINYLGIDYSKPFSIIEPAVGEGHIISLIIERFLIRNKNREIDYIKNFLEKNIYAFDIRQEAVDICIKKLNAIVDNFFKDLKVNWQIYCFNALEKKKLQLLLGKFDYVISNPPYITRKNINEKSLNLLKEHSTFCSKFNFDIYYYFFEIGIELWNKKGKIVYITPNNYLRARSSEVLLKYFIENNFIELIKDYQDYLNFEDATTYTAITVLSNGNTSFKVCDVDNQVIKKITYEELQNKGIIYIYDEKFKVDNLQHFVALDEIADIKNGLATLQDKVFIINEAEIIDEDDDFLIFKKNNEIYTIEKKILKVGHRASKLDRTHYVIFPYDLNRNRIIDVEKKYPLTYNYLNSSLSTVYKNKYQIYFGRTQGFFNYNNVKILIPRVANLSSSPFKLVDSGFALSSVSISFYKKYTEAILLKIIDYLNSSEVLGYLSRVSKNYASGYNNISTSDLKKILIPVNLLGGEYGRK